MDTYQNAMEDCDFRLDFIDDNRVTMDEVELETAICNAVQESLEKTKQRIDINEWWEECIKSINKLDMFVSKMYGHAYRIIWFTSEFAPKERMYLYVMYHKNYITDPEIDYIEIGHVLNGTDIQLVLLEALAKSIEVIEQQKEISNYGRDYTSGLNTFTDIVKIRQKVAEQKDIKDLE